MDLAEDEAVTWEEEDQAFDVVKRHFQHVRHGFCADVKALLLRPFDQPARHEQGIPFWDACR